MKYVTMCNWKEELKTWWSAIIVISRGGWVSRRSKFSWWSRGATFLWSLKKTKQLILSEYTPQSVPGDTPDIGCILADSTLAGCTPDTEPLLFVAAVVVGRIPDSEVRARQCRRIRRQHRGAWGCAPGFQSISCYFITS